MNDNTVMVVDLKKGRWARLTREALQKLQLRDPFRYINAQLTPVAAACKLYPQRLREERLAAARQQRV